MKSFNNAIQDLTNKLQLAYFGGYGTIISILVLLGILFPSFFFISISLTIIVILLALWDYRYVNQVILTNKRVLPLVIEDPKLAIKVLSNQIAISQEGYKSYDIEDLILQRKYYTPIQYFFLERQVNLYIKIIQYLEK